MLVKSDCVKSGGTPRLESALLLPHRTETSCFPSISLCIKATCSVSTLFSISSFCRAVFSWASWATWADSAAIASAIASLGPGAGGSFSSASSADAASAEGSTAAGVVGDDADTAPKLLKGLPYERSLGGTTMGRELRLTLNGEGLTADAASAEGSTAAGVVGDAADTAPKLKTSGLKDLPYERSLGGTTMGRELRLKLNGDGLCCCVKAPEDWKGLWGEHPLRPVVLGEQPAKARDGSIRGTPSQASSRCCHDNFRHSSRARSRAAAVMGRGRW